MTTSEEFQTGVAYKIASAVDGNVMDISGCKLKDNTKIVTWEWNGGWNQKWMAINDSVGFRLQPDTKMDAMKVLDSDPKKNLIILWGYHGQNNQQWLATPVPAADGRGAVFIQNLATGACLRNQGRGNQVSCALKSDVDKSQWWYIVPQ